MACSILHYDIAKWDYESSVRSIAKIGYEGIELHSPPKSGKEEDDKSNLRRLLRNLGLKTATISSQKWDWAGSRDSDKVRGTIEAFKDSVLLAEYLESERVITETGRVPDDVDFRAAFKLAAENVAFACDFASSHGIKKVLLESVPPPFNYVVDNSKKFLEFREICGARNLFANVDASNYLMAGDDPTVSLKTLGALVKGIHVKDGNHTGGQWTPIDEGEVNWQSFFQALREIHYDEWLVVEYEGALTGKYYLDPERASRDSLEFIRRSLRGTSDSYG